ncbi:Glycogen synthase [Acaryochloris thomasi RCC1774]|uniref:Glycogen synthase n=1 Tax=Acaryochloris thomasi RCC1774 TaxID=1764569 RepID=A0A2W1JCV5_9CYAN|nr:glycosyltransferase [Acaryochloris thomasi]PZD71628.1 Glycogen synthase [Acaryochloris thomasi RCC1774]
MKIALIHDYLTQRGGAERVFKLLCHHFPTADIYTSLYDPVETIELGDRAVQTTVLQNIPGASKHFRLMAPFYYSAFRALDLRDYDLLISSSTSFAKSVRKRPDAQHICFCHNVTRFLWDTETYLRKFSGYQKFYALIQPIFQAMRSTDLASAREPDLYIANSTTVASRIKNIYSQNALVVNYPIDASKFSFSSQKQDYYLVCSRLLSYKRIDVVVDAFNALKLPLKIIGEGPEEMQLKARAGSNIEFLGPVSDSTRMELMAHAQAVLVAALEDYGLVPIEANASGTPVIAYGAGGVLDTQVPGQTGVFFKSQTAESVQDAVTSAAGINWDYRSIQEHALSNFSETIFFQKVDQVIDQFCDRRAAPKLVRA